MMMARITSDGGNASEAEPSMPPHSIGGPLQTAANHFEVFQSPPARPLPDLPDLRPTYETQVGQTQTIDKHDLFTIRPTARLIFKEICFKGDFHIISPACRASPGLRPFPALQHQHALLPIYAGKQVGQVGQSGRPPENGSFPPF